MVGTSPPPLEEVGRDNFKRIFSNYDTILICVDGVLWRQDGVENVGGAGNACHWLNREKKNVFYLSNRDNNTRVELQRRLRSLGIDGVDTSSIITSGSVMASFAASKMPRRKKVFVVGGKGLKAELDQCNVSNIGSGVDEDIVCAFRTSESAAKRLSMDPEVTHVAIGADPFFNSGKGFKAATYVKRGAKLLILDEAGGRKVGNRIIPGAGAALAFLRVTLGPLFKDATYFGLPHAPQLRAVREMLPALKPRRTLVIGDSLTEHVTFARDQGMDALLVMTGSADETQVEAMRHAMRRELRANEEEKEVSSAPTTTTTTTTIKKAFRNVIVVFIVGGPGCGKGTQCDRLKSEFGFTHISSGDLLREEVASGSKLGREFNQIMERGDLVPMALVLKMIKTQMLAAIKDGASGFLIDGYPREEEQGILFENVIRPCHVTIYFSTSEDTMLARMRKRGLSSGRPDDNEFTMHERLKTFYQHSKPILEYFKRQQKLIEVDAEAETSTVFQRTIDGLKRMFLKRVAVVFVVGGPGCGKGTQCERLKETFRLQHISSGDLLRDEVASGSAKGKQLKEIMDKGELVSMKLVQDMIRNTMIKYAMLGATGFLLDGYPREESQAVGFETEIRRGSCCISYVLDDDEMLRRMRHRAETSGRSDDNEVTMTERLKTFHKNAQPVVNYFKTKEKLIQIYAGEPVDVVFNRAVDGMTRSLLKNVLIIFIVGGPGCGKGTQCDKLKETFSLTHISSGDLLRDEVASGSTMGKELNRMMVEGILVPMETVLKLIQCTMLRAAMVGSKGFLIDGFPREERQAVYFESLIGRGAACVYFNALEETMLQRMRHRGAGGGRADDNEATMKARLKTFKKHAEAVVEYFRDSKRLIEVNAEDRVDTVYYETCLALRARGIFPGLKKNELPACPRYILNSLGDISNWVYRKPPSKPPTPSTCCCKVLSPSEEQLRQQIRPNALAIVTIIGSPGTQRSRVVQHVAKQFGLFNLDEHVIESSTINSECDFIREQVRRAEKTKSLIPWSILTKLLKKRIENEGKMGKCRGIVLGLEAREDIFAPKTNETLLETVKLISDSVVICYLVHPRDSLYRKHMLSHVTSVERHFKALDDKISTPNWANVWTKYVKVKFGKELRKRVQTTEGNKPILEVCACVDRHISECFLRDLTIVFIVGGPGVGKTSLANRLAETYLFKRLNIDEMVEREIASESLFGKSLKAEMIAHQSKVGGSTTSTVTDFTPTALPFQRVSALVRNAVVHDVISGCRGFIVDAFPTCEEDAILFAANIVKPRVCLTLKAEERTLIERTLMGGRDLRESAVFKKVSEYVSASGFGSVLSCDQVAPILEEINADAKEDAVFSGAVSALTRRRIFIPPSVAAVLKKSQIDEEERLLQNAVLLFIIGGPGSGKSLLSDRLREAANLAVISIKALVQQEADAAKGVAGGATSDLELAKMVEVGEEVDSQTCIKLLRKAILKTLRAGSHGIVIDGFPKDVDQALEFEKYVGTCTACLHLEASMSTMLKRSLSRSLGRRSLERGGGGGEEADEEEEAEKKAEIVAVKSKITDFQRGKNNVLEHYRTCGKLISIAAEDNEENIFKMIVENLRNRDILKRMK